MRIIKHNFSDFYDGVMALGHDEDRSRVYLRTCQVIRAQLSELPSSLRELLEAERVSRAFDSVTAGAHRVRVMGLHLVLAGKTYRAIRVDEQTSRYEPTRRPYDRYTDYNLREGSLASPSFFYDAEQVISYLADRVVPGKLQERSRKKRSAEDVIRGFLARQGTHELEGYGAVNKRMVAAFERYDHLVVETINPQLASVEFFKHMTPWTVYQELDMYLGGVIAAPERPSEPLEDKYRIAAHGFDKASFRKPPEKRR